MARSRAKQAPAEKAKRIPVQDDSQRTAFDRLDVEELEWAHAQLGYIRSELDPVANNLMTQDDPHIKAAGQEVLKLQTKIEGRMSVLQAGIRRLKVPDEGDPPSDT